MNDDLDASFLKIMDNKQKRVDSKIKILLRDVGNRGKHEFICDKFIYFQQSNSPEKYFLFERLVRESIVGIAYEKKLKKGDIEYRISYYIVSRKDGSKHWGKWKYGQSSPMIPPKDFDNLIKKAKQKGVMIA
jgi:hypothetical protein